MNDYPALPVADLSGQRIGLSGAIPDPAEWAGRALDWEILNAVSTLTNTVCRGGGHLVHGSHPSFTPRILAQAAPYAAERGEPVVTLYLSELFVTEPFARGLLDPRHQGVMRLVVVPAVYPPGHEGHGAEDEAVRNASLTALREQLVNDLDALVVVGGKRWAGTGKAPGTLEELELARARDIPTYLLGGLGGMAAELGAQPEYQEPGRSRALTDGGRAPSHTVRVKGFTATGFGQPAVRPLAPEDDAFIRTTLDYGRAIGLIANHLAKGRGGVR